jgi:hypothetical protein
VSEQTAGVARSRRSGESGSGVARCLSVLLLAAIAGVGCTSGSSTPDTANVSTGGSRLGGHRPNRPPVIVAVALSPNPIALNAPVATFVDADDPDDDPLTFRHRWFVNGWLLPDQAGPLLPAHVLKKGDRVMVEVTPLDGKTEGQPMQSAAVSVGNTPPEVAGVLLEPAEVHVGETVRVQLEAKDVDDDDIHYSVKWWRNNKLVLEGAHLALETGGFTRGDHIVAQVTPLDGAGAGRTVSSQMATIVNSPPTILSNPPATLDRGRYLYTVAARDADGDALRYSLESAPVGMTVEPATGQIEWVVSPNLNGSHRVKVVVEDGQKGQAFQEFDLAFTHPS